MSVKILANGDIQLNGVTQFNIASVIKDNGDQKIAGIKTFTSSPIVPTPTTNTQAVNKTYVDLKDEQNVKLSGNQTIAGVKTFTDRPLFLSPNNGTIGAVGLFDAEGNPDAVYIQALNNERNDQYGYLKFNKNGTITPSGDIVGNITGNAGTVTKLSTARTIGGVAFDGSANINLPGVNTTGNQNTTGNAATATVATLAQTANLAPIGDVSNAAANTTFVYRAQGNLKLQTGVLGNVTLTQDMAGSLLIMAGTPTLPPINTIRTGSCFYLLNTTTAAIGIGLNGNIIDTNYPVLYPKETLILQSDGGYMYRVVSRSREFASNMNTAAGFTYFSNGMIMQWGYGINIHISPKGGTLDITFPIAFPSGVFFSDVAVVETNVNNQIVMPFCVATNTTNLHITNNDVDSAITQIRWIAIGY